MEKEKLINRINFLIEVNEELIKDYKKTDTNSCRIKRLIADGQNLAYKEVLELLNKEDDGL